MTVQTDVKQSRLTQSGWIVSVPCRVKGVSIRNSTAAVGRVFLFDTTSVPVTAAYAQSGTTVTVTKVAHGLVTGDVIGIGYSPDGSQRAATCGQYSITKVDADTFTITDPNSFTVSSSTACYYTPNGAWMYVKGISAADQFINYELIPGEGLRAKNKVYVITSSAIQSCIVYYG